MVEENFQIKRSQMHQNGGFLVKSHSIFYARALNAAE
jgi:hypothetical protein